jgi:hypothetical protein
MNGTAIFGDEYAQARCAFAVHNRAIWWLRLGESMTGAMAAFWAAVAGASLMTRLQNRRRKRRSSGDGAATDGGNFGNDSGWSLANWFGGDQHSAIDSSGSPIDFGAGDGGDSGAGDGGGGDGGGGAD